MGCDIHTYLEYADFTTHEGEPYWMCYAAGFGSRDYRMFSHLAGVRGMHEPVHRVRGLPDGRLSYETHGAMFLRITEDQNLIDNGKGYASASNAESWGVTERDEDGNPKECTHPDMHSHSWLTLAELREVIAAYMFDGGDYPYAAEWDATLAAMQAFEDAGKQTRIVFAFDN